MVQGVTIEKGHIVDCNPATGAVIARVKVSTNTDVDAAVAAARKAQPKWAALSLEERTDAVRLAVRRIGDDPAALAKLITQEMGKTLRESEEEVADNADKVSLQPCIHRSRGLILPAMLLGICAARRASRRN